MFIKFIKYAYIYSYVQIEVQIYYNKYYIDYMNTAIDYAYTYYVICEQFDTWLYVMVSIGAPKTC